MVAAVFNEDDGDLTTFFDQFDDLLEADDPAIDDNLNDLFPAIWTEEESSSKLEHSVPNFALQEALTTAAGMDKQQRSVSPISVLNNNTGSGLSADLAKTMLSDVPVQGRARTKLYRQPTVNRTPSGHQLVHASLTWTDNGQKPEMESKRKTKKFKLSSHSPNEMDHSQNKNPNSALLEVGTERKCTHCEITKTPLWRLGPLGPKTLCNACGVRYKSGRLFPEYRPAANPTFSPSKHSNSHRKVIEMREKGGKSAPAMYVVKAVEGEENHLVPVSVELIADDFCWA